MFVATVHMLIDDERVTERNQASDWIHAFMSRRGVHDWAYQRNERGEFPGPRIVCIDTAKYTEGDITELAESGNA
jgi:hypothetical protein